MSQCFGGRISDKELTERSGLFDQTRNGEERFSPGDAIMADRAFHVHYLVKIRKIQLNYPPFLKGRSQLSEEQTVETHHITSLRIHVEHAIERIKNYCILTKIPNNLVPTASRLVCVCTMLTTLMPPLVPPPNEPNV